MSNPSLNINIGFYNKYQKYANKLIQIGGEYNYFIENIKNINDDILKKLDENQSNCWKITEMNSSLNRKKYNYDVMYRKILNLRTLLSEEFLNIITIFRPRLHTKRTLSGFLNLVFDGNES